MEKMSDKLKLYMVGIVIHKLQNANAFPEELRDFLINYKGDWDGNCH